MAAGFPHLAPLLALALMVALALSVSAAPFARLLADYTNADGNPPDGLDNATDDTPALQEALAAGPGIVWMGPGYYRLGDVGIPSGVTLAGAGSATILRPSGPARLFVQENVGDWAIRDLTLDGESELDWDAAEDSGQSGIAVARCSHYEISGVTLRRFGGAALQIARTGPRTPITHGGNIHRIVAYDNYIGIRFDVRAEYINVSDLSCDHNITGCIIHGGNLKITNSNFINNRDGLVIEDKDNGSHGAVSNCLLNHNQRYALLARNAANGMVINGCCFFYGEVRVENSKGINITDGILGCTVSTAGEGVNRLAGNQIVPGMGRTFTFSPGTILDGNFTNAGLWEHNNR